MSVLIETSLGDIVIDLHINECPITCKNFLKLCKVKYYNFCTFHNVQKDFMAQTGDPTNTGKGGESVFNLIEGKEKRKYFMPETHPRLNHDEKGTVSMVITTHNSEKGEKVGLAGSQFFITLKDGLDYLDSKYAPFGKVAEGMEVLDKLSQTFCDDSNRPLRDIRIKHTIILDDPFEDPEGLIIPEGSPEPTEELLKTLRVGEDEELDPDLPPEELEKIARRREAAAQALTLEMVGDLPFADVKPPENVLFVCKLNPVTQDEDLELIFSRFGKILSCEIIRDSITNESLCYAFIEFEDEKACEEAYFKMDNVLIDDRRIHVDFSQSVSKLNKEFLISESRPKDSSERSYELKKNYRDNYHQMRHDFVFDHKSKSASRSERREHSPDNGSHRSRSDSRSHYNTDSRRNRDERDYRRDRNERDKEDFKRKSYSSRNDSRVDYRRDRNDSYRSDTRRRDRDYYDRR